MRVMTEAYKDKSFFVPLNREKTEGVYVRPVTATMRREGQMEAVKEAGADLSIADFYASVKLLQKALTGWVGFYDMNGADIPFSVDTIKDLCECDPSLMGMLAARVGEVARLGELEDKKN